VKSLDEDGRPRKFGRSSGRFPRVARLRKLLGNDVLLLPWPLGCKGTRRKWGHFTLAKMAEVTFLRQLKEGNIGVALGSKSGGVCSIDFDSDAWVDAFLAANPALQRSLRTRGARGCNLWVRCAGIYPATGYLKSNGGEDVGEWRATGSQTIISGKHPSGCKYSIIVEAPPAEIGYEDIVWPTGLIPPKFNQLGPPGAHLTEETDETQETQKQGGLESPFFWKAQKIRTIEDLVFAWNHGLLFHFARGLVRFEQQGELNSRLRS
jgi:Bifunctional DNA primase/polymerase, N-terminal